MPVSPDDGSSLAKAMLELYSDAEERLLQIIAKRLAKGIDEPSWADRQLLTIQALLAETRTLTGALLNRGNRTLAEIIGTAFNQGAALAGTDLLAAKVPRGVAFGGVNVNAIKALVSSAQGKLDPIGLRIQSSAGQVFRDVLNQTAQAMLTGTATRRQASAQALSRFAQQGVTGFVDTAGRSWSMTSYAEMTARTAASHAIIQGHVEQLSQAGFDLGMVSDAPEECRACRPWEGKILSLKGFTPAGTYTAEGHTYTVKADLRTATSAGLFHPNAVLGDHKAGVLGDLQNAVRAWYVGPSVHLTTSGNRDLTVSPNHPVLTARGWISAGSVRKGDKVFRNVGVKRDEIGTPAEEHLDDPPSTFEQVFDALSASGCKTSIAASADDFHGDGRHYEGEVQVVWADRLLLGVADPVSVEQRGELSLVRSDVQVLAFAGSSSQFESLGSVGGPVARALPDLDPACFEPSADSGLADGKSVGDVLAGLPCEVALDEIINVERGWYSGHAYDLQTSTGAYATDDIIIHNCRHRTVLYLPGVTRPLSDTADPGGDQLRQQQRAFERRVRELKRQLIVQQELNPDGVAQIKARLKAKTTEFTAWRSANDRKNLAYRTSVNFQHVTTFPKP